MGDEKGNKKMILAKGNAIKGTNKLTGVSNEWTSALITEKLNLKLLKSFKPGIVKEETYYIYAIQEMPVE